MDQNWTRSGPNLDLNWTTLRDRLWETEPLQDKFEERFSLMSSREALLEFFTSSSSVLLVCAGRSVGDLRPGTH